MLWWFAPLKITFDSSLQGFCGFAATISDNTIKVQRTTDIC